MRPSECRAVNEELTELLATLDWIQASTTAVNGVKRGLAKHLIKVMEMINVKIEEVMKFRELKKHNAKRRLWAISAQ